MGFERILKEYAPIDTAGLDKLKDIKEEITNRINELEDYVTQHRIFCEELEEVEDLIEVKESDIEDLEYRISFYHDEIHELQDQLLECEDEDEKSGIVEEIERLREVIEGLEEEKSELENV